MALVIHDVAKLQMNFLNLVLQSLVKTLYGHKLFCGALLFQEKLRGDTKAMEQGNDLPVEEPLAISGTSNDVKGKVIRWKLNLTWTE